MGHCCEDPHQPWSGNFNRRMSISSNVPLQLTVAVLAVVTVIQGSFAVPVQNFESQFCRKFVEPYGYICAEYRTQSEDGYMLVVHRIGSRRRILQHRLPVPDMSEIPPMSCENQEHPFNSPGCLPLQPPSTQEDLPKSDEGSPHNGDDSAINNIADQNFPYQVDQIPSSNEVLPYVGEHSLEDRKSEQLLPYERSHLWGGHAISGCDENEPSELCQRQIELPPVIDRSLDPDLILEPLMTTSESTQTRTYGHEGFTKESDGGKSGKTSSGNLPLAPVTSFPEPSRKYLSNGRSYATDRNGSIASDEKADNPQSSTSSPPAARQHPHHRHHSHHNSSHTTTATSPATKANGPDRGSVGIAPSGGAVHSAPEPSTSDGSFLIVQSEAPGSQYSAPQSPLSDGSSITIQSIAPSPVHSPSQPSFSDGPSVRVQSAAPSPVYYAPEQSVSDGPSTLVQSEAPAPDSSLTEGSSMSEPSEAPVSSPNQAPSAGPSEALSPSPMVDQVFQEFVEGRDPVLLMHQEFMSGESWFQFTESTDRLLPFLLLDAGFDVWIGHERATFWSHDHVHFHPNEQSYWNWTWDDHARSDVPAFLELINEITRLNVHYIGISQSATVGAAAATMPRSSRLIKSLTLIGPTMFRGNSSSLMLEAWAFLFGSAVDQSAWDEGYQNGAFNFSRAFPVTTITGQGPLALVMGTISGPNCCLGSAVVSFNNGWDGTTSFKNLLHYQQGVRTNTWSHYDYRSPVNNTLAYGVPYAPAYYPEDIPPYLPVLVIYGGQDEYAPPNGNRYFLSRFRGRSKTVFLPSYAHYDLSYSVNRTQDVFIPILQFLEEHR
ncbi:lysosomal acid lipase/cholesteryl ester hydrolase [Marchantia polymorpha subsp. ruderalis]|uniref:Partial AB-hydrolase lipase domain-containing protein n=2 Tax=Marchantia polymorpha TaxID=3197 RepID=A0AAF6BDC4_MARPO|nr:hypothetical protein MARPO_0078s0018 [Marchantia polymorpha]BBN10008.1 hypothetical protein Mp_5g00170 [Marchantia polymorpha subsp. ruderalis]|eukprot:PTQ34602.1 hypothetical protein MARPO_0078s0018 [Marchantia polymorpha]